MFKGIISRRLSASVSSKRLEEMIPLTSKQVLVVSKETPALVCKRTALFCGGFKRACY
jgi:hypothetical protein